MLRSRIGDTASISESVEAKWGTSFSPIVGTDASLSHQLFGTAIMKSPGGDNYIGLPGAGTCMQPAQPVISRKVQSIQGVEAMRKTEHPMGPRTLHVVRLR